jgi:hypothetical protein
MNESDSDEAAKFFVKNRPGLIEALPNSFMAWEGLTDDPRKPFASVKYFSSTFDAIHPRTIRRLLESSERRAAVAEFPQARSRALPATCGGLECTEEDRAVSRSCSPSRRRRWRGRYWAHPRPRASSRRGPAQFRLLITSMQK